MDTMDRRRGGGELSTEPAGTSARAARRSDETPARWLRSASIQRGVAAPLLVAAALFGAVFTHRPALSETAPTMDGAAPGGGAVLPGGLAGASPSRFLAVASSAAVIVSSGGAEPIELGARQPWAATRTLHVWDWTKGRASRPLAAEHAGALAVSPDGRWIVTADGRRIDAASSKVERVENFAGKIHGIAFSPDGGTLLLQVKDEGNDTATMRLLDFPSARKRLEIPAQFGYTFRAAFSADGRELVLMNKDRSLGRWDASSGKELMRYEPAHSNSIRALALSADGRHVVSAGPAGEIFLWDSKSGKRLHQLVAKQQYGIESMVYSLAFSPDGSRLAGGGPQNLVLWKVSSGEVERVFPSRSGGAIQIRFAKDGKKITTVHDFHGTESESGQDLLVYPTVGEWQLEEK